MEDAPELGRTTKATRKAAGAGRKALFRASSILIFISMISTVFAGFGGDDPVGSVAAAAPTIFTTPVRINTNILNDQSLPVLVKAPDGSIFVAWQDARAGVDNDDIYVAKSIGGSVFSAGVRADNSITVSKQIDPAMAISGTGTIYLAWQDNRKSKFDYDIFFAKSTDGGVTFSNNIKVDDSSGSISWQERPSIAVTSNGIVYVAWTDDRTGLGQTRIRGAYSTDGGATFSASSEIVPTGTSGQDDAVLAFSGNRLFAAFLDRVSGTPHAYVVYSTNGGKTFSSPVRLDGTGESNVSQRGLSIAQMAGGGIVASWEDSRNGNWDIYASIVSSRGIVTTADIRVDDDTTFASQSNPNIAADGLGNLYAAWRDDRDSIYAIRFAYLEAGNTWFNTSLEVAGPGPNDMQRMPSLVVAEPGRVVIAWQDDEAGTYDVYASTAFFTGLFGLSLKTGWNLVSIPSDGFTYWASTLGLKTGDLVSSWNSTLQMFDKSYIVGISPPPSDFVLTPSTGYWISTVSHERIKLNGSVPISTQSKHVAVPQGGGWIMIGLESLSFTKYASDIPKMHNVPGAITMVSRYNTDTGMYESYANGIPMTDFALTPGEAYYCWSTTSGTLTYTP
jgi:hypothetical protein